MFDIATTLNNRRRYLAILEARPLRGKWKNVGLYSLRSRGTCVKLEGDCTLRGDVVAHMVSLYRLDAEMVVQLNGLQFRISELREY